MRKDKNSDKQQWILQHLACKALFLSFVVHAIVMHCFMFVLPAYEPIQNPTLSFLGSLLKNNDIYPIEIKLSTDQINKFGTTFIGKKKRLEKNPFESRDNQKPPVTVSLDKMSKLFLKTTFLETTIPSERDNLFDDIGVYIKKAPYIPLRLNRR